MNNTDAFQNTLINQEQNILKRPQFKYYKFLYDKIRFQFGNSDSTARILEIGAGPGLSRFLLAELSVERTDLLDWPGRPVIGKINAESLPFPDDSFTGAFAVDTFHHLQSPHLALKELIRVTAPGSKIVLIEPYVSIFSFPVYKAFHSEKTTWRNDLDLETHFVSSLAADGDQGIPKSFFCTREGRELLSKFLGFELQITVRYFSFLSFFATGGLTHPLNVPTGVISTLLVIEKFFPNWIMRFLGSRMIIVIDSPYLEVP